MDDQPFYIAACVAMIAAVVTYLLALVRGEGRLKAFSRGLSLGALLVIVAGLIARGAQFRYWPLASTYEFALVVVAASLLLHLLIEGRVAQGGEGLFSLFMAAGLAFCLLWLTPAADKVPRVPMPFFRSPWFALHTLAAAFGYAAFAIAGGMGLAYLVRLWRGAPHWWPEGENLDLAGAYAVRLGFPLMTLGIATGGIWSLLTWGSFWTWDVKESWALVVWLTYLFYVHGRALPNWAGKRSALVAVLGLAVLAFAFLGMRWLSQRVGFDIPQVR